MGYGGVGEDSTSHLGQSGDEGVDGVIREDELGLDLIYVQAKRWANPVGRPEIQKFFGALHGKRASKGVFITTSSFTSEARAYADSVTPRIILVDGHQLARLMVDYGVGVSTVETYELKRVNLDYFTDEDDATTRTTRAANAPLSRLGAWAVRRAEIQADSKRAELVLKRPVGSPGGTRSAGRNRRRHSTVVLQFPLRCQWDSRVMSVDRPTRLSARGSGCRDDVQPAS